MTPWIVSLSAWFFVVLLDLAAGWKPRREAGGTWGRLLWVSAALGILQVSPVVVWAVLEVWGSASVDEFLVAFVATTIATFFGIQFLKSPVSMQGTKRTLPRVEDERLLARIAELAQKMKVTVPLVRLLPSLSGSQQALAFAGTLHAPQIVVTDGILARLDPVECDAIVAHELAHFANGSLWMLAAVMPLSCAVTTALSGVFPLPLAGALGMTFWVGLRRLVSRPIEIDCDRRAAEAIGFRETASALAKIHTVHPIPNSGLVSLLVYATATHPPVALRCAALRDAAPEGDHIELGVTEEELRRHRTAAIAALVVWSAALVTAVVGGRLLPGARWFEAPLWIVSATPLALLIVAQRQQVAMARRREGHRPQWVLLLAVFVIVGSFAVLARSASHPDGPLNRHMPWLGGAIALSLPVVLFGLILFLVRNQRKGKLRREVLCALQVHDFEGALELGRANPKVAARDHLVRYNLALARAARGQRAAAIVELEWLWEDKPRFPLSAVLLCELLLDADQPELALEMARKVSERLPGDAAPPMAQARALRRLGRIEEAQAACDRAASFAFAEGIHLTVSAALALDRSDASRATGLIARAIELAPGECYVLVVQAEIALETLPLDQSRPIVERAVTAVRANPLIFLESDTRRLEQRLAELAADSTVASNPFVP